MAIGMAIGMAMPHKLLEASTSQSQVTTKDTLNDRKVTIIEHRAPAHSRSAHASIDGVVDDREGVWRPDRALILRMKLLTVLLLLGFTSLAAPEVVQSFGSKCPQFFIPDPQNQNDVITPTILQQGQRYKQICQRFNNQYRFVTLYDTRNRIPVYSAYTFYGRGQVNRGDVEWKVEPQLDINNGSRTEMEYLGGVDTQTFTHQARDEDYQEASVHERGHLFPHGYAADQDQADSTCTLTNIAPQTGTSNRNWEAQVETPMLNQIQNGCRLDENNPAYIVTGVVPGENWLRIKRGRRTIDHGINIPRYYWTAYSCINNNDGRIYQAFLAQQINHIKDDRYTQFEVTPMNDQDLNTQLTELYGTTFHVFRRR
ncbi:uncharacterized protein LOC118827695 [Colossoma macropomum]|uniref:uncharacterized protein LOC118827695 n=1 Tax=Colossoma macropomum TaxID=42526 RepID=UPI0018650D67|nr:uncharacterized protein LOC118827695 [Colossoma macropomum]